MSRKVLLKIIILGDSGVGKTSILHKYVNNRFIEEHKATIGADFSTKEIMIDDNRMITLQLWDTAGQERFQSLGNAFYRGADACILVYDITSKDSFDRIPTWRQNFINQAGIDDATKYPFLLLGNKADLETQRQVSTEEAKSYSLKQKTMKCFETSALTGQNLEVAIRLIANLAANTAIDPTYFNDPKNIINLEADHEYDDDGDDEDAQNGGDNTTSGNENAACCQII